MRKSKLKVSKRSEKMNFYTCYLTLFSCSLLFTSYNGKSVQAVDISSVQEDIAKFNIKCYQDTCDNYHDDSLSFWDCHCGIQCVQLGTCCLDSYYVNVPQPALKPTCRSVYNGEKYFMVDECPSDSAWSSLCNEEWHEKDSIQQLVPVTSHLTSITYKNYYCLRCHETTDDFTYWTVKIGSSEFDIADKAKHLNRHVFLTYNRDMGSWTAMYNDDVGSIAVNIYLQVPYKILELAHSCYPDVISNCSEIFPGEEMKNKCKSYMSIKESSKTGKKYKNTHCALCNGESLDDIQCKMVFFTIHAKKPFSFTYLLDINSSDGELVGKIQRCAETHVWDPYTKKCRQLTCAQPGYKVQNGKCVQ